MPQLPTTTARTMLFAVALVFTGVVAYQVCRIPVQVSDSVGNLLQIQHQSLWDLFLSQFSNGAYVRPLLWVQIKLGYDLAAGHEQLMFKGIHMAQLLLLAVLFVRPMQVETRADLAAAVLALLVLFGLHTFDGTVREAFPINAFLTVVLCVLAATNLAIGEPRWWRDLAAVALFCFAILTVESGILVVVAVVAARLAGLRGVSWRGVALTVLACTGYLVLRFAVLDIGSPGLGRRVCVWIRNPGTTAARRAVRKQPLPVLCLQRGERARLRAAGRAAFRRVVGHLRPVERRLHAAVAVPQRRGIRGHDNHLSRNRRQVRWWLTQGVAQPGSRSSSCVSPCWWPTPVVSFPYSKDVIMSTGGVFFALAIYAGTALLLGEAGQRATPKLMPVFVALALSCRTPRAVALPYRLKNQAANAQCGIGSEVYPWLDQQQIRLTSPDARDLVQRLRAYALRGRRPGVEWTGWRRVLDLN